jgi:hypothetical protein
MAKFINFKASNKEKVKKNTIKKIFLLFIIFKKTPFLDVNFY